MNKNRVIVSTACLIGLIAASSFSILKNPQMTNHRNLTDEALLALIKNDQKAFEGFLAAGGNLHHSLPQIDGQSYTVAQGISYFERSSFAQILHEKKMTYVLQDEKASYDIMTLAISKNNPDLFKLLSIENPNYSLSYGKNGWTMLHMASAQCSHKLTSILHDKGKLSWDQKAKDGSTPLTLAAQSDCLPMLSYWKDQGADFKQRDGRGMTALSILQKKKDAALLAFAQSFEQRKFASVNVAKAEPDFYRKRKIPKDQIVDYAGMIEPEDRPLEATETAEFSEFAD